MIASNPTDGTCILNDDQPITIAFVVAVAENGVIGRDGGLPWRQSSDLKRFRQLTMGKPIVMGRKTFQSIGKPLDGRDNIVVSRDPAFRPDGVEVAATAPQALSIARAAACRRQVDEIMVIGGAQIYAELLPDAGRIYLTRVHCRDEGDAHFADLEPGIWREVHRETLPKGERDDWPATLSVLERTGAA
jgi:dihydrofolate reductase